MTNTKNLWIALGVVAIVAIAGLFYPQTAGRILGAVTGTTNFDNLGILQLKLGTTCNSSFGYAGCNGTAISRLNKGTCYIQPYATTIAASSTAAVECQATAATGGVTTANDTALTGVTSGDAVFVTFATSTAITAGGGAGAPFVVGAVASSTAGYIHVILGNMGQTYTWPTTGTASGTMTYWVAN